MYPVGVGIMVLVVLPVLLGLFSNALFICFSRVMSSSGWSGRNDELIFCPVIL